MTSIQNIQYGQIGYLYSQLGSITPPTSSNLADVLLNGFSAGASDIDMNNNDILQVSNIDLATINGAPYPPVVAADTLQQVLTAGNTANIAILIQDVTTPATLFSQMSDAGFQATNATGSPQYDASVSASSILVSNTNGDSNTIQAGLITIDNPISTTTYSIAGIDAGNQPTSIDYQVTSNMAIPSDGYGRLDLTSGDLTTTPPRAVLQAFVDLNASPSYVPNINLIDMGGVSGEELLISNGNSDIGLAIAYNTISMFSDSIPSNSFIELKSVDASTSAGSSLFLGQQQFGLTVANQSAITIGSGFTDPVVFRRNISTTTNTGLGAPVGMLENSVINATTTGTTTLTTSDAFATIINTPTLAGRIFVLPTPTAGTVGYWYAICNKAISTTIAVQYPLGTTIAVIPVAPSSTNGGSVARFAVTTGGASYFVVSDITNASNATNVGITSDNNAGTYYLPFVKTSGSGNKSLFIDDTTGPLTYNPSTGTVSATTYKISGTPSVAVDASTFGQVGLVKITSVQVAITGSVLPQNLSFASLFNSTYKNYRIILHPTTQVAFTQFPQYSLQAFLGTGTLPTTASLYGFEMISSATTVVSPVYTAGATISSSPLVFAGSSNTNKEIIFDIQNVGYANTATQQVSLMCKSVYGNPGITGATDRTITCSSISGATITGLVIQKSALGLGNNFTLEMVVYGYNNL